MKELYVYFEDTPTLAYSHVWLPPSSFPSEEFRGGSFPRRQTARQQAPKRPQLLRVIDAKPFEQSAPASESILGTPSSIIKAKESLRLRRDRAVDAHFRFRAVGGADAERLGTAASNSAYSSPTTLPTSSEKPKSIVEAVRGLERSEHRESPSFCQ